jgi:hypothetical protein
MDERALFASFGPEKPFALSVAERSSAKSKRFPAWDFERFDFAPAALRSARTVFVRHASCRQRPSSWREI